MTIERSTGNHMHHNPGRVFPEGYRDTELRRVRVDQVVIVDFRSRPKPENRVVVKVKGANEKGGVLVEPLEETEHLNIGKPGKKIGLSGNTRVYASFSTPLLSEAL